MYPNNNVLAHGTLRPASYSQYTVVAQETIQNSNLSDAAYRILMHIGSMVDAWQVNITHIMNEFGWGYHKARKALAELRDAGYYINERVRENGRFIGSIKILKMTPDCVGKVVGGEILNPDGDYVLSTRQKTSGQKISRRKQNNIDNTNSDNQNLEFTHYPKGQCVDLNDFDFGRGVSAEDLPSVDPTINEIKINPGKPSDPIKNTSAAACDKIEYDAIQDPPLRTSALNPKSALAAIGTNINNIKASIQTAMDNAKAAAETTAKQSKPRLTDPERLEYKNQLATIDVHIDDVSHAIARIDLEDRPQAVANSIAWVRENSNWIKDPAAMFVAAIREGRMPTAARNAEIKEVKAASELLDEVKQFNAWRDRAKEAKLIDYCYRSDNPDLFMIVVFHDGTAMTWQDARVFLADKLAQYELEQLELEDG